jgi:hypothetical protein
MFNFLMKKMLKSQMKGLPEAQQELILAMFEKDPQFFKQMADEIKEKTKQGKSQQQASMEVMFLHKDRFQQIAAQLKK